MQGTTMPTNTSVDLRILPSGSRSEQQRTPRLHYKPGTLTAASSDQDIRNWSKSDQKLFETLQRCREQFAERQRLKDVAGGGSCSQGGNGPKKKTSFESQPQFENTTGKRSMSKCPQFKVVSDGIDYTAKRKRCIITPRTQTLLNIKTSLEEPQKRAGIVLKFPIQVTGLKPEKPEESEDEGELKGLRHGDSLVSPNQCDPPAPTPIRITIPTGLVASAPSSTKTVEDCSEIESPGSLTVPTRSSSEAPESVTGRTASRKKIVRVATNARDISPSVSSTAHVLLEKKLSKVTYNFPSVTPPTNNIRQFDRENSQLTLRNYGNFGLGGRQDSTLSLLMRSPVSQSGSFRDSPQVSLPRIPKFNSPYTWTSPSALEAVEYVNTPRPEDFGDYGGGAEDLSRRGSAAGAASLMSSVKTPPTMSLPNTPDSDRQYVQTGEGAFVLNIVRSMTVSSLSTVSSSQIKMFRTQRDKSNLSRV